MAATYFLSMSNVLGGAERVGLQIAGILASTFSGRSLLNRVLEPHTTLAKASVDWMHVPASMVKISGNPLAIVYYIFASLWFFAKYRPAQGTVFYCNDLESVILAAAAKFFSRGKIIWHVHDVYKLEKRSTRMVLGLVSLVTDVLVCLTTRNAERMASVFRCRVEVIPNFCRLEPIKVARTRIFKECGEIVFGYLGQITRWKRVDAAIRLVQVLNNEYGVRARLKIGGVPLYDSDRPYKEELLQLAGNTDYIEWCGAVSDPVPFFAELDFLLSLSDNEPFGLVIVEALSQGVPIISSIGDGPNEIINQCSGFILDSANKIYYTTVENILKEVTESKYNEMSSYCVMEAGRRYSVESFNRHIIEVISVVR